MQALASRIWTPEARHHPGQLAWSYAYGLPEELHHGPAAVFERDDEVVAWAWAESDDWLELCVDPTALDAGDAAIAWFLEWADERAVRAMALDTEEHVIALLDRAGFLVEENVPWFTHHFLDSRRDGDAPGRRLHPAPRRARRGRRPRGLPSRRLERDLEGQHRRLRAADAHPALPTRPRLGRGRRRRAGWSPRCACGSTRPPGVALVEPVGCVPEHRGRGLAGAVSAAALAAARDAGATTGMVCPRGDDGYPVPMRVYQRIGFAPGPRTITLVRPALERRAWTGPRSARGTPPSSTRRGGAAPADVTVY